MFLKMLCHLVQVFFEMLLEVKLESGLALEGLVALAAVHLGFGVGRHVANVRDLDRRLKVALFTPKIVLKQNSG